MFSQGLLVCEGKVLGKLRLRVSSLDFAFVMKRTSAIFSFTMLLTGRRKAKLPGKHPRL
jgi:hypothetical protein